LVRIRIVCGVGMGAVDEERSSGMALEAGVSGRSWLPPGVDCADLIGVALPGKY